MQHLLGQLKRWRLTERLIRLAWGGGRWAAAVGAVLAAACLTDWLADRYLGSEAWRDLRAATWVFAPDPASAEDRWFSDHMRATYNFRSPAPAVIDDTPGWLRAAMTAGQMALALALAYLLLVRPWRRTPPVDDLAQQAEKAIPAFGHRLVTAVQLNRPTARTEGMSKALIADVTREAGEMAARHNLLKLVDYRRLGYAALVLAPVLLGWVAFATANPPLAKVLLQRQALMNVEIPRSIQLENKTDDVWPTGSRVLARYRVTGAFDRAAVGRVRVEPDGQPEFSVDLKYEKDAPDDPSAAYFVAELPEATIDFSISARLDSGRTRDSARVRYEAPPQLSGAEDAIRAELWLPKFLGTQPDGGPYVRYTGGSDRGDVIGAVPLSQIRVDARFSKPVKTARLIPVMSEAARSFTERLAERVELEFWRVQYLRHEEPVAGREDRLGATWLFPTNPRLVGYRIELTDDRGFKNAAPIRRKVEMIPDGPPRITFLAESTRHPNPKDYHGDPRGKAAHEWGDKLPLRRSGFVLVIYSADSPQGVREVNLRYRVIPPGFESLKEQFPEGIRDIQHPRDDPGFKVFGRYETTPVPNDPKLDEARGRFVPDLGLFETSWDGKDWLARQKASVELYSYPSPNPAAVPGDLTAGGRIIFKVSDLKKPKLDENGNLVLAELEVGDTVELYVEAFDKNPTRRLPGYTDKARAKIVVTDDAADKVLEARLDEENKLQNKVGELAADQADVFKSQPPKK